MADLVPLVAGGRRLALVTGANKGIGKATATGLAAAGVAVLMGARDLDRGAAAVDEVAAGGGAVAALELDITSSRSVADAAAFIRDTFGRLDILVNNAAVKHEFHPAPPSTVDLALVRSTYETNVFGTMQVMQAMLPLLRNAEAGRVVNVSSGLGSLTMATTEGTVYRDRPLLGYNTAKAALNALSVQFANELRDTSVKVNVADPGYTRTDMTRNDGNRSAEHAARVVIELALLDDHGPTAGYFDEHGRLPW